MLHPACLASGSQGVIARLGATTVSTQTQATCGGRERLALAPTLLSQSPQPAYPGPRGAVTCTEPEDS